jgi:hypothetical protein
MNIASNCARTLRHSCCQCAEFSTASTCARTLRHQCCHGAEPRLSVLSHVSRVSRTTAPSKYGVIPTYRAALRVGLAGSRVRISGSVLKSESAPTHAMRTRCLHTRETDSDVCFGALSAFKTKPQILSRLPADPALRAARPLAVQICFLNVYICLYSYIYIYMYVYMYTPMRKVFVSLLSKTFWAAGVKHPNTKLCRIELVPDLSSHEPSVDDTLDVPGPLHAPTCHIGLPQ